MSPETLLVGPYVGEFGWELFCWQGIARKFSKEFKRVVVVGRPGNKKLYEDFCDEYIEFDPESWNTDGRFCPDGKVFNPATVQHNRHLPGTIDIGYAYLGESKDWTGHFTNQEFVKYTSDTCDRGYDILFHCRNKATGSDRNWSKDQWVQLRDCLSDDLSVACIGNDQAFKLDGCADERSIPLEDLVSVMGNSKLIAGPSSGPMHLASLCGLKHLVWSTDFNYNRYTRDWNPFNTDVIFYDEGGWNPDPSKIGELINGQLSKTSE